MEEFFKEQGERLNSEYSKIHEMLETDLKRMYYISFQKVSECFGRPGSMDDASTCANTARAPIESYNQEMSNSMGKLEANYKSCLNKCGLDKNSTLTDQLRTCVVNCTDGSVKELSSSTNQFSDLTRRFLR